MTHEPAGAQKGTALFGIGKILPFLKKFRRNLILMVTCGLMGSLVDIILPLFRRYALDHYVGNQTMDTIFLFVILYAVTVVFAGIANYISCSLATITEVSVNRDLRETAFRHLQTLSFSYFNQNSVGYIHARVMSDTSRIGSLASWTLMDSVWHISYLVGSAAVMISLNARLAGLVLLILPVLVVLFSFFQKKLIRVNREVREINSRITGNFNEGITGAKTIKSLAIEDEMSQRFMAETSNMRRRSISASRLRGVFAATMNFAASIALAIVLWKGGYIAESEVGTFSAFMSYAQGMM